MRADCIYDIIKKFGCFSYDCILFDGPWGIGKTYAIDKALEEQEKHKDFMMMYIFWSIKLIISNLRMKLD